MPPAQNGNMRGRLLYVCISCYVQFVNWSFSLGLSYRTIVQWFWHAFGCPELCFDLPGATTFEQSKLGKKMEIQEAILTWKHSL